MAGVGDSEKQEKYPSLTDDGLGPAWMFWRRRRYIVASLAFFGFFNVYSLRVNLSIAVVAMTRLHNVTLENGTVVEEREFDWDTKEVGLALSSFFYGYIWTQLAGGWISSKLGGNRVYCIGVAATSILTVLTPIAVKYSFTLFIIIRIIEGLFEGVTFPCIHAVWSQWAPPLERSTLAAIGFTGSYIGTVVAMPLSGVIANTMGWEGIFYIFGVIGVIWCIIWTIVVKKRPRDDPYISTEELEFIEKAIGHDSSAPVKHPWKDIVKSKPVWAIVCAHFAENWGFYTMLTQLPSFMFDTLNFKITKAGFLSGLPYLAMSFALLGSGQLADWLRSRKIMSTTAVRKTFNCSAFVIQTVFMMLSAYLHSATGIVTCIVLAVGCGGFAWTGFAVNHLDIAPMHASVLMGFGNTFATLPGIVSPLLTGYIVQHHTAEEWRIIFFIASGIYVFGAVVYGIWASGEVQPWAVSSPVSKEENSDQKGYLNKALVLEEDEKIKQKEEEAKL